MKHYQLLTIALTLLHFCAFSQNLTSAQIDRQTLRHHLEVLASDSLQGRQAGSGFDLKAASYINNALCSENIQPLGQNGFQYFSFTRANNKRSSSTHLVINGKSLVYDQDFTPLNFTQTDSVCAKTVFVGYGLEPNYEGIDATNKWVAIISDNSPFDSCDLGKRIEIAQTHKAAGILLLSDETQANYKPVPLFRYIFNVPTIELHFLATNYLLQSIGNIKQVKGRIANSENLSQEIPVTTCAKISSLSCVETTQNVIATIIGTDSILSKEFIVIGAHYDHLGLGGRGSGSRTDSVAIHNGADDNASGVAVLLEVAQKIKSQNLRRSIAIVAFGAEEYGLLGSKEFIKSNIIPPQSIKVMINLDMVGRMQNNNLTIKGTGSLKGAKHILNSVETNIHLNLESKCINDSDHAPFYEKRIPVLFLHTGMHNNYHTPTDNIELINFDGLYDIAQFTYKLIYQLSNMNNPLVFQPSQNEIMRSIAKSKVKLGLIHNFNSNEHNGYKPLGVEDGSPAAKAGIIDGDVVKSINGTEILTLDDYISCLKQCNVNSNITLVIVREGIELTFNIKP